MPQPRPSKARAKSARKSARAGAPASRGVSKNAARPVAAKGPAKRSRPKAAAPRRKSASKRAGPRAVTAALPAAAPVAARATPEVLVLVVGDHPAALLCALLLNEAKVPLALADLGTTPNADRLVTFNPAFFDLHKSLRPLRDRLKLAPVTRALFLGREGQAARTLPPGAQAPRRPDVLAYIGAMNDVRDALRRMVLDAGIHRLAGPLAIEHVDERGARLRVNGEAFAPKLLAVADPLPPEQAPMLDLPRFPGRGSQVQATAALVGEPLFGPAADPEEIVLSLDLGGELRWGWLLRHGEQAQLCVQCPPEGDVPALLEEWTQILHRHGILSPGARPDPRSVRSDDLPLGGALMRDVVARRTLLFGPAGGFYSASGEDVYPTCWSARYAAEIASRAARADHPQDALGAYRGRWGSTLGDYLRGPQQNLRFLLPLVYRNPVMTERLANAIFMGESLVK